MLPGSNVTPLWPSNAVPPGCFSELARLNQCYNEIQMMEMILSKVMVDLINNDPAVIAAIQAQLAAKGAGLPITGVTSGVAAQPGIVGEYVQLGADVPFTATAQTQSVTLGILQPGDWYCQAWFDLPQSSGLNYQLNPVPTGFSNGMEGAFLLDTPAGTVNDIVLSSPAQALISVPTAVVFMVSTNSGAGGVAGTGVLHFTALRVR